MWLLLKQGAEPAGLLEELQAEGVSVQAHPIGQRWMLEVIENGYTPEAFLRWEEVERVIAEKPAFPLVATWQGTVNVGSWRRGEAPLWIAGPCSVERKADLLSLALSLRRAGVHALRGGAYKARTSPYAFQGLGEEALDWLAEAKAISGLPLCVEVVSEKHLALYQKKGIDILQVGARNMDNYWLLQEVASLRLPVLLKRNPQARLEEWLLAAEYLLLHGAPWVMLCERGIRTFDYSLRYTLDVGIFSVAAQHTALPVVADPSHAAGRWQHVAALTYAALAAGAEGILVEVHTEPFHARSDAAQQLTLEQFLALKEKADSLHANLHSGGVAQPLQSRLEQ
ncbi:MAG: 3-deoxy-7-phosphoheptulonate synthase [Bacteroidia bacterium]|nr:3-deoxy-7-phosphoheptulonate synthase [Bacteroidia bacterium]MDW8235581.1 3-deoxy-7-phosphoheptulonate synthase [Bacteroidia bacterium]